MKIETVKLQNNYFRYNVHKSPYDPVFELSAKTDGDVLKICAAYNGGRDATDMVVIEAELLSGYNFFYQILIQMASIS